MKTSITTLLVVAILALGVMGFVSVNDGSTGELAIHPPNLRPGGAIRPPEHITPLPIPIRPHPPKPPQPIPVDYVYVDTYPDYVSEPTYTIDPNTQWQICVLAREFSAEGLQPSEYLKTLIATYCTQS